MVSANDRIRYIYNIFPHRFIPSARDQNHYMENIPCLEIIGYLFGVTCCISIFTSSCDIASYSSAFLLPVITKEYGDNFVHKS